MKELLKNGYFKDIMMLTRRILACNLDIFLCSVLWLILSRFLSKYFSFNEKATAILALDMNIMLFYAIYLGYYIIFWNILEHSTVGQFCINLKMENPILVKNCIKKVLFLTLPTWLPFLFLKYAAFREITPETMDFAIPAAFYIGVALLMVHWVFILKIDNALGIKLSYQTWKEKWEEINNDYE